MFLISIWILILSFQTWEFRASPSKHWNSGTIYVHVGILAFFFINIGILPFSFQKLEFWSYFLHIGIFTLSFQTFEFWSYFVNYWNSGPILTNMGILILSLQATNIWRHRNSYIVLLNIWILALCFTHWKFDLILSNIGILRYFYKHCNFYLILPLRSLEFWPCFYRRWNFDVIPPNIAVQAIYTHSNYYLILLNIGFGLYFYTHWNFHLIV